MKGVNEIIFTINLPSEEAIKEFAYSIFEIIDEYKKNKTIEQKVKVVK